MKITKINFVGRNSPVKEIRDMLNDKNSKEKVRIISISGPAGIGKTFLLENTLMQP